MGDQGTAAEPAEELRAAGAVVWRPVRGGNGVQVAVVHRPKYDDWSLPKGKLETGEHVLLAAVREVAEEAALRVTLGRRLPAVRYVAAGMPKRVDYWVATAAEALSFEPGDEIDDMAWVAADVAAARLSYERDVATLAEFSSGPRESVPLILIRHASAGSKADWPGDDASRPLDSGGAGDARALAELLRCFGAGRVVSAPAERCIATVRPYAESIGAVVETEAAFDVGGRDSRGASDGRDGRDGGDGSDAATAMGRLAADNRPVVVCAHRENMPALLDAACAALGAQRPVGKPLRKAEFAVLHRAAGTLAALERYHPDGDALARASTHGLPVERRRQRSLQNQ